MKEGEETKNCGACHKNLTITSYSKKQWQLKKQRRCKECIESDIPIDIEKIDLNNDYCKDDNKEKGCAGSKDKHSKKVNGKGGRDNEVRGRLFNNMQHDVNVARSVVNEMSATATTNASTQSAQLPPPTLEQVSQMKKMMSDPKQLAKIMSDKGSGFEALLRGNPDYAKSIATNPFLQHQPNMNEEDIKRMAEIVNNLSDEAVRAMITSDYTVDDDKKVSMQPARKITNEAACWVCLDDGADDEGNPLVRDCSCRGNMGFAHLSCLKKYAKSKGMKPQNVRFITHWVKCPHCLQDYQGDLAVTMSDACLAYFENAHKMFKGIEYTEKGKGYMILNNMARCMIKFHKLTAIETLSMTDRSRNEEGCQVGEEIIMLFDQISDWKKNDPYVRSTKANLATSMECDTYKYLARLYSCTRSPENDAKVIEYSERAIRACKAAGQDEEAKQMERILEAEKAKFSRKHAGIREESEFARSEAKVLPKVRKGYHRAVSEDGDNCAETISYGKNLVLALLQSGYGIECHRLLTKLIASSKLVNGPDHPETEGLGVFFEQAKWRNVLIENPLDVNARPFQMRVVGYYGQTQYALSGATKKDPPSLASNCDDEMLWIQPGTPVLCMGLQSDASLNGKIGDVRRRDKKTKRYSVHFADTSLKSKSILGRNLRVLIDVPDENEVDGESYIVSNIIKQRGEEQSECVTM